MRGVPKGSVNTNFRLETSRGTFFLRLDETRRGRAVEQEARLLAYLAARDFPTPEPLRDRRGRRVGALVGKPLTLFPWVEGEDQPAESYTRSDLQAAGAMLARLHRTAGGFRERIPNRFGRVATITRWSRIRGKAALPAGDRTEIDLAIAWLSREPVPQGPEGLVHGDWFADNLLFRKGRIVGVLDFEAAAHDALAFDVGTAVNALCWLPSRPDRFLPSRVEAFLEGYRAGGGKAATSGEVLRYWLAATAIRFTVTRVQDFRLRRSKLRVEKDYRDFLSRLRFWMGRSRV